MFFLFSNMQKASANLLELTKANALNMVGPVEILQLRNPADKQNNVFVIFKNNISGAFYASFSSSSVEELNVANSSKPNGMNQLHSHEYYEFMFVISGEIYQNIEHDRHYYPAGGCCLVSPYVMHTEEYDTNCRVLFFKVSQEFMQNVVGFSRYFPAENSIAYDRLKEYLGSGRHFIDFIPANGYEWIKDHVHSIFEEMIYELSTISDSASLKLALYTNQLMMELFDDVKFSNTPALSGNKMEQELFQSIRDYMMTSVQKVTRSELEARFTYSGDYIYKIIKNHTGMSIHEYGSYLCIQRSAELLSSTNLNINEIAETVGFHNFTHFYKEFKKYYQMTPREYRLRTRNI